MHTSSFKDCIRSELSIDGTIAYLCMPLVYSIPLSKVPFKQDARWNKAKESKMIVVSCAVLYIIVQCVYQERES